MFPLFYFIYFLFIYFFFGGGGLDFPGNPVNLFGIFLAVAHPWDLLSIFAKDPNPLSGMVQEELHVQALQTFRIYKRNFSKGNCVKNNNNTHMAKS